MGGAHEGEMSNQQRRNSLMPPSSSTIPQAPSEAFPASPSSHGGGHKVGLREAVACEKVPPRTPLGHMWACEGHVRGTGGTREGHGRGNPPPPSPVPPPLPPPLIGTPHRPSSTPPPPTPSSVLGAAACKTTT